MTSRLPFLERWVQEGHFDIYFVFFKRRSKSDLFRESSCFLTSDELTWPWRFVYLKTEIKSFILIFTFQNINQVLNFVRQPKVILGQKTRLYVGKGQISSLSKNSSYSDSRLRDLQSNRNFWTEHLLSDSTDLTLFQLCNRQTIVVTVGLVFKLTGIFVTVTLYIVRWQDEVFYRTKTSC